MVTFFFLLVNIVGRFLFLHFILFLFCTQHATSSFRCGILVRKKLTSSLYLNDTFIEVHETLWILLWWMSSIAFSYSSDYIFLAPRLFLFNLQFVHAVLLVKNLFTIYTVDYYVINIVCYSEPLCIF